ncbi:hypothetical protein BgiMline_028612, partial [Biomphalaria glabrata]
KCTSHASATKPFPECSRTVRTQVLPGRYRAIPRMQQNSSYTGVTRQIQSHAQNAEGQFVHRCYQADTEPCPECSRTVRTQVLPGRYRAMPRMQQNSSYTGVTRQIQSHAQNAAEQFVHRCYQADTKPCPECSRTVRTQVLPGRYKAMPRMKQNSSYTGVTRQIQSHAQNAEGQFVHRCYQADTEPCPECSRTVRTQVLPGRYRAMPRMQQNSSYTGVTRQIQSHAQNAAEQFVHRCYQADTEPCPECSRTVRTQTTFQENGQPRTIRVSKPVHESIMGRIKKTFTGSSAQISPVKGLKRLCNGEVDRKKGEGEIDNDVDSTGGVGCEYGNLVSIEETEGAAGAVEHKPGDGFQAKNGDVSKSFVRSEASKFLFKNEGRVESEEETVLDNGAVGSPKIVLTSPKSKGSLPRAQTYDSGVGDSGRGGVCSPCHKRAIEIVQDADEITVVVRGDVSVRSEDLSDPNSPRTFIISTQRHNHSCSSSSNNNSTAPTAPPAPAPAENLCSTANIATSIGNLADDTFSTTGPMSPRGSIFSNDLAGGRTSPSSGGRTSPSKSPVTSPTKASNGEDEFGRGRSSDRMKR